MKLSSKLNEMLVAQVHHELKNASIYRQIACYFEDMQLKNIAKYFHDAADQEFSHSKMFIQHINDRNGGKMILGEVDSPEITINSMSDVGNVFVSTEELTTEKIEDIMEEALLSKSYIDVPFIEKMLCEQVEEEDVAMEFAKKATMVTDLVLWDAAFGA